MEKFSSEELDLLNHTDFLKTKASALAKVNQLLAEVREELMRSVKISGFRFPEGTNTSYGKISIGENYRGLPYQVLDYPSLFTREDTFAFRTMFWWGNFFSATFYMEGKSLDHYREQLLKGFEQLKEQDLYICIHESPWEHHFENDNYRRLDDQYQTLEKHPFIKLASKWELEEYMKLPVYAVDFLKLLTSTLSGPDYPA